MKKIKKCRPHEIYYLEDNRIYRAGPPLFIYLFIAYRIIGRYFIYEVKMKMSKVLFVCIGAALERVEEKAFEKFIVNARLCIFVFSVFVSDRIFGWDDIFRDTTRVTQCRMIKMIIDAILILVLLLLELLNELVKVLLGKYVN